MKRALIVQGGLKGHEPAATAEIMAEALRKHDFEVEIHDTFKPFGDSEYLKTFDLLIPHWTAGQAKLEQLKGLFEAIRGGVGVGAIHGGGTTSFAETREFQLMFGGLFICHPGGTGSTYTVHIEKPAHPITETLEDFELTSEQYYMHVDPGNNVLATTLYPAERAPLGSEVIMPVTWTRRHGKGRVFYTSLGHDAATLGLPPVLTMATRGLLWAAGVL